MRTSRGGTKNWASTPVKPPKASPKMSKTEFRSICAQLGIRDNETASVLLGPNWRTCQRYWYEEAGVPAPLARLLRLAVRLKLSHLDLRKAAVPLVLKDTRQDDGTDL